MTRSKHADRDATPVTSKMALLISERYLCCGPANVGRFPMVVVWQGVIQYSNDACSLQCNASGDDLQDQTHWDLTFCAASI